MSFNNSPKRLGTSLFHSFLASLVLCLVGPLTRVLPSVWAQVRISFDSFGSPFCFLIVQNYGMVELSVSGRSSWCFWCFTAPWVVISCKLNKPLFFPAHVIFNSLYSLLERALSFKCVIWLISCIFIFSCIFMYISCIFHLY